MNDDQIREAYDLRDTMLAVIQDHVVPVLVDHALKYKKLQHYMLLVIDEDGVKQVFSSIEPHKQQRVLEIIASSVSMPHEVSSEHVMNVKDTSGRKI